MKIKYHGSKFWLICWLLVFLPIGLTLLLTDCSFIFKDRVNHFKYDGSRFWLCFWVVFFFPIALLLLLLNGFSLKEATLSKSQA